MPRKDGHSRILPAHGTNAYGTHLLDARAESYAQPVEVGTRSPWLSLVDGIFIMWS